MMWSLLREMSQLRELSRASLQTGSGVRLFFYQTQFVLFVQHLTQATAHLHRCNVTAEQIWTKEEEKLQAPCLDWVPMGSFKRRKVIQ
ncbi:MAG: hypothetical protein ACPGYX_06240 [Oceanobacter sp.]